MNEGPCNSHAPDAIAAAAARGGDRLLAHQDAAGRWEGEVVWCPVITAQAVLAYAIMRRPIPPERRRLILLHFARTRRPDGGWGLHPESRSYLFVTTLVYVAARLLGEAAQSALLRDATAWLARHDEGLDTLPTWGRFWLSLLGLYERERLTVCPPELFLLPAWFPVAPDRLYCHTRAIYLGMAYLSGAGLQADLGEIGTEIRQELAGFIRPGRQRRYRIAATDVYVPPGCGLRLAYRAMATLGPLWHRFPGAAVLRRHALRRCLRRILAAQVTSAFQGLSPVNGVLNTLALWAYDPQAAETQASIAGLEAWCWQDETDGLRYAGARSTSWDTAFAIQALVEAGNVPPVRFSAVRRAYARLAALQVTAAPDGLEEGRQDPTGGWCFGDPAHGWPVSDCTAEAISALLLCHRVSDLVPDADRIAPVRLEAAVRFLLDRQNADGGFATYERRRGGKRLERLNPSEMFGACMTEGSYIECTASAIRALRHVLDLACGDPLRDGLAAGETPLPPLKGLGHEANQRWGEGAGHVIRGYPHPLPQPSPAKGEGVSLMAPDLLAAGVGAMRRAADFLLAAQRPDGAWPGFWGINFIYATGFAIAALRDAGMPPEHPAVQRAVAWLSGIQQADGGWGEHFSGCLTGTYIPNPVSLVISTSWAVLGLLRATGSVSPAGRRGLDWLAAHQAQDGDWPRDSVNGVFFGTAMLDYRLYNTYFPVWAFALAGATGRLHCNRTAETLT